MRRVPEDAPAGTGFTLDAIEAERYQRDNEDVFKIKPRLELDVRRDRGVRPLSPLWAETELLRRCQRVYYEPLRQDILSFGGGWWLWAAACSWVAWQTPAGALQGAAAFDYWGPLIWRDKLRPDQNMTMSEAEVVLRHALETGEIVALAVLDGMQVEIPKNEWTHLKWKCNNNGEVVTFDQLCIGAKCYRDVKVSGSQLLEKYPVRRDEIKLLPAEPVRDKAEAKAPDPASVVVATGTASEQSDVVLKELTISKSKGGRPKKINWSLVYNEANRLMEYHGSFTPDDPKWNARTRLEDTLISFCEKELKTEIGLSTLRGHLHGWGF